jgi:hypothetical protein
MPALRLFAVLLVANALAAGGAAAQDSRPVVEGRRLPSRDRYTASRPATIERFRSVFDAYDLDGDGRITQRGVVSAGFAAPLSCAIDFDGDAVVDRDEFDYAYAREISARGQELDGKLTQRVRDLEDLAKTRRWIAPESRPTRKKSSDAEETRRPPIPTRAPSEPPAARRPPSTPQGPTPRSTAPAPSPSPAPAPAPPQPTPSPRSAPPRGAG